MKRYFLTTASMYAVEVTLKLFSTGPAMPDPPDATQNGHLAPDCMAAPAERLHYYTMREAT